MREEALSSERKVDVQVRKREIPLFRFWTAKVRVRGMQAGRRYDDQVVSLLCAEMAVIIILLMS